MTTAQKPNSSPTPTNGASPTPTPSPAPSPDVLLEITPPKLTTPQTQQEQQKNKDDDVIKVETRLINVTVTALDPEGRVVPNIPQKNFQVYELDEKGKKVEQQIDHFESDDGPIVVGIIPDLSGSMSGSKTDYTRQAISTFMRYSNREDDVCVLGFGVDMILIQDYAINDEATMNTILNKLALVRPNPKTRTALYDGMYININKIQEYNRKRLERGQQSRKMALLVISDGQDNNSRYTFNDIKKALRETDIIVYAIVIPPDVNSEMDMEAIQGMNNLTEITDITGGKAYKPDFPLSLRFPDEGIMPRPRLTLDDAMEHIATELRSQYTITYYPTNKTHDGKYRKIFIKVTPPKGMPRLVIRAKPGYTAPKN